LSNLDRKGVSIPDPIALRRGRIEPCWFGIATYNKEKHPRTSCLLPNPIGILDSALTLRGETLRGRLSSNFDRKGVSIPNPITQPNWKFGLCSNLEGGDFCRTLIGRELRFQIRLPNPIGILDSALTLRGETFVEP